VRRDLFYLACSDVTTTCVRTYVYQISMVFHDKILMKKFCVWHGFDLDLDLDDDARASRVITSTGFLKP
jgi:hypothetical protein